MSKLFIYLAAILVTFMVKFGFAQTDINQLAPIDPELRTGVLENGLTYYIRHNEEPKERASFYIIQNVGALLEEDNQNGLAHFLEHMAFNGTEHFEGKGVLNTLEKHGVAFGRNINAYTAFNETVYNLSDVPVKRDGLLDTCLLILHDWSNYLLLTEDEINAERGVITEEWRTRRNSSFRLREQWFPVIFKGSKWAVRDIIGDTTVIRYHEPQTLRSFYHDWYRTDLQAIAIVGDFDVDEVEQKVIERFSSIPAVADALPRPKFAIPHHNETYYVLATDKEATQSQVNVYIIHDNNDGEEKTLANLKEDYISSLYNSISSMRIQELLQKGTPPFVNGFTGKGSFVRGYDVYNVSTTANTNQEAKALEAIMIETERLRRFGVSESELERAKINLLTGLESRYKERDKINNDRYAAEYAEHYLVKEAVPGIEFEYQFVNEMLPTITAKEVSELAARWIKKDNRTIVITGPNDAVHITEAEAKNIIEKVEAMEIEPYNDVASGSSLIDGELLGSKIVASKKIEGYDAVEWTLANNTKVVFRHADYEKDNVSLMAFSKGGSSIWDDQYIPATEMINVFMEAYGVGQFDAITLQKMLTGKKVSIRPTVGNLTEGFSGSSTPKDFETMMQLLYLYFEKPNFDLESHDALMSRYMAFVANMEKDPRKIMQDSLSFINANYHPRVRSMNTAFLEEVKFEDIKNLYLDRIQDAGDFTFFIVGNIEEETAKAMVEKYIGSLSDNEREETWVDREINAPKGKTERIIPVALTTPKTNVNVRFVNNDVEYKQENVLAMSVFRGILDLRYTETVREDEGGTYGVGVGVALSQYPEPEGVVRINFDCDPSKADHLKSIIYREIDKIIAEGPTETDFNKTILNHLKDREQARNHNSFWLSSLYNLYFSGIDSANEENYELLLKNMTKNDIQQFVAKFFKTANVIDVVFVPKD
ncbi:MAG TPA: insulinase family protein [Prolixibacteraceae bacterium]|nr:insulinase family protein [Prolixibacteraceae bacterium]